MDIAKSPETKKETLEQTLARVADELKEQFGPDAAVVVMVGTPDDDPQHSRWGWHFRRPDPRKWYQWRGRCLDVAGLATLCAESIRAQMQKTQPS